MCLHCRLQLQAEQRRLKEEQAREKQRRQAELHAKQQDSERERERRAEHELDREVQQIEQQRMVLKLAEKLDAAQARSGGSGRGTGADRSPHCPPCIMPLVSAVSHKTMDVHRGVIK